MPRENDELVVRWCDTHRRNREIEAEACELRLVTDPGKADANDRRFRVMAERHRRAAACYVTEETTPAEDDRFNSVGLRHKDGSKCEDRDCRRAHLWPPERLR